MRAAAATQAGARAGAGRTGTLGDEQWRGLAAAAATAAALLVQAGVVHARWRRLRVEIQGGRQSKRSAAQHLRETAYDTSCCNALYPVDKTVNFIRLLHACLHPVVAATGRLPSTS